MNQLPISIRREAKRLLKLAQAVNGHLSVKNLSEAQEIISKTKGAQSAYDALVPTDDLKINELNLAIALSNAMNSEPMMYMRTSEENVFNESVIYIFTDNYKEFEFNVITSSSQWDPSFDPHNAKKFSIAISLYGYMYESFGQGIKPFQQLLGFAMTLCKCSIENNTNYLFGYINEGDDEERIVLENNLKPFVVYSLVSGEPKMLECV